MSDVIELQRGIRGINDLGLFARRNDRELVLQPVRSAKMATRQFRKNAVLNNAEIHDHDEPIDGYAINGSLRVEKVSVMNHGVNEGGHTLIELPTGQGVASKTESMRLIVIAKRWLVIG